MQTSDWLKRALALVAFAGGCSESGAPSRELDAVTFEDAAVAGDAQPSDAQPSDAQSNDADAGHADSGAADGSAREEDSAAAASDAGGDAHASSTDGQAFDEDECSTCVRTRPGSSSAYCSAEQPVLWTCSGPYLHSVGVRLAAQCSDVPTGAVRYCCAEDFARECPRE